MCPHVVFADCSEAFDQGRKDNILNVLESRGVMIQYTCAGYAAKFSKLYGPKVRNMSNFQDDCYWKLQTAATAVVLKYGDSLQLKQKEEIKDWANAFSYR